MKIHYTPCLKNQGLWCENLGFQHLEKSKQNIVEIIEDCVNQVQVLAKEYDLTISTYNSELGNVLILGDNSFAFKNTQTESIYNTCIWQRTHIQNI